MDRPDRCGSVGDRLLGSEHQSYWLSREHAPLNADFGRCGLAAVDSSSNPAMGIGLWSFGRPDAVHVFGREDNAAHFVVIVPRSPYPPEKSTRAYLAAGAAGICAAIAPLGVHFALHPEDAFLRLNSIVNEGRVASFGNHVQLLLDNTVDVLGAFMGWAGDPNARHNLPGYPPFTPMLAVAFVLGLVAVALGLRRREPRAWTLLLWWGGMCIAALLAADANPHFVRLFGALPAALLLAAWPLAWPQAHVQAKRENGSSL